MYRVMESRGAGSAEQTFRQARRSPREPGPREVLIRIHAAAVNPIDCKIRSGAMRPALWPLGATVLGYDCCGQVLEVGPEVTQVRAWDWVMAMSDRRWGGCYSEQVCLDESVLAQRPQTLSPQEAAALPLAGLTAHKALIDLAKIEPGHRALIIGASGGVGHLAVQIARLLGARVTAVCSTANVDWVAQLGARQVIDYTRHALSSNGAPYDVILDCAVKTPVRALLPLLAEQGIYVATLPRLDRLWWGLRRRMGSGQRLKVVYVRPDGKSLARLAAMADQGLLRPRIAARFALDDVAAAHRLVEAEHSGGKVVLDVAGSIH